MICFAWSGFPQYAARCVGAFVKSTTERVVVVATRPGVPIEGMEKFCGCEVVWIDKNDNRSIKSLCGELPRVMFVSGWGTRIFNRFRDEVRGEGGKVFAMVDNNFLFSLKEVVKAMRFRLFLRGKYDGFLVPGKSAKKLLRFYGANLCRCEEGMYAADDKVFNDGGLLLNRDKVIVFIGRFIPLKNIEAFMLAFKKFSEKHSEWRFECYGSGPELEKLKSVASECNGCVKINGFVQPEELCDIYKRSRILVLPSHWDHWGLVVHEAALSGCALLLSNTVGSGSDLCTSKNGKIFNHKSIVSMEAALEEVAKWNDSDWTNAHNESLTLAGNFSCEKFSRSVIKLIDTI